MNYTVNVIKFTVFNWYFFYSYTYYTVNPNGKTTVYSWYFFYSYTTFTVFIAEITVFNCILFHSNNFTDCK